MEFDKSRVYTALNAGELKVGSKCIFADTIQELRQKVQGGYRAGDCAEDYFSCLAKIFDDDMAERLVSDRDNAYLYAYLIAPPAEVGFRNKEKISEKIAAKRGYKKNKEIDYYRLSNAVLNDFRSGKYGKIQLDYI